MLRPLATLAVATNLVLLFACHVTAGTGSAGSPASAVQDDDDQGTYVTFTSSVDLGCVSSYQQADAQQAEWDDILAWARDCRTAPVHQPHVAILQSQANIDCFNQLGALSANQLSNDQNQQLMTACTTYTLSVTGTQINVSTDLSCVQALANADANQAEFSDIIGWARSCRSAPANVGHCAVMSQTIDAGCETQLTQMNAQQLSNDEVNQVVQVCSDVQYACY